MNCPFCLERYTRRGVANGTSYIVRLRQTACRMASPWRLSRESASSGKVFLLGEADSTQCAFRGRQQAVRIVTSLRRWAHFFSPLSGSWHAQVGIQHVSVPLMPLQLAITSWHYAMHCGAWSLQYRHGWKSFSSGAGRQGRQRIVGRPVGDSPLESASIGRQSGPFMTEAGRAGSA